MRRPRGGESQELAAPMQPGHLEPQGAPVFSEFAAVVWAPDPEQRHGWREHYIRRPDPHSKPNTRPVGFGRPHGINVTETK